MKKDFSKDIFLSFETSKQFKNLYDLARFIERNQYTVDSSHFQKLKKYHLYLDESEDELIIKLNKEFNKIKNIDYQFQLYLMLLERFIGQSTKDYQFLVQQNDGNQKKKNFDTICLLDSIRSAHNIGSFFRNAEALGCSKLILTGLTPKADHPQVIKTSMGTVEHIDWEYAENALEKVKEFKSQGYKIFCIETGKNAIKIEDIEVQKDDKIVLVFGHEQYGISLELLKFADQIIKIELFGNKNSLNVAVSQSIILNTLHQKFLKGS